MTLEDMNNLRVYQVGAPARQRIRSRIAANSASGTATFAIWKIAILKWYINYRSTYFWGIFGVTLLK
jgi:hypothetical protein